MTDSIYVSVTDPMPAIVLKLPEPTSGVWDPWEAASANTSQALVIYEPNQTKRKIPP
jgi:hypothetical protein